MTIARSLSGLVLAVTTLDASSFAQSFHVDCVVDVGPANVPSSGYRAAAGAGGFWNAMNATQLVAGLPLVDADGNATSTTLRFVGPPSMNVSTLDGLHPSSTGDDHALLDDTIFFEPFPLPGQEGRMRFEGLANGDYALYTYATSGARVSVTNAVDPEQWSGGVAWPGEHAQGASFALHRVAVTDGTLDFRIALLPSDGGYTDWNGTQLVKLDASSSASCAGDGTGAACPCGNSGAPGRGCASSFEPLGASLVGSDLASVANDAFALSADGVSSSVVTIFQGSLQSFSGFGAPLGDGVGCLAGSIVRIASRPATSHALVYPSAGDAAVSVRGQLDAFGGVRFYQLYYRNAASFCTPATFNVTNAVRTVWAP